MNRLNRSASNMKLLALCAQVGFFSTFATVCAAEANPAAVPVVEIGGDTVTSDELTSFAIQLEQTEGMRSPNPEALLNEFILSRLYDKIPTTTTLQATDVESTAPTQFKLVSQRSLLKRELRQSLTDSIQIPRNEMQTWYNSNVEKYTKPERIHAWHIFMETREDTPSSSPAAVRSRLDELKAQIDSGTSFSQLAEKHSEAASGESGGEIGQITRRMPIGPLSKPMNLELENALFNLAPAKVSGVINTRHGMHLLFVTEKETTRTPSLDDLITSGILPGVLAQDRLTSELKSLVSDTVKKYQGQILPGFADSQGTETVAAEVTPATIAFRFDGKDFNVGHLIAMFGPRFASYLESAKQESEQLRSLLEQALEDEAMVRAAVEKEVARGAEIAKELELLGQREIARKRIDSIATAEAATAVNAAAIQDRYNELKNQLRQPEAEGALLMIKSDIATGTAEQARSQENVRKLAESIQSEIKDGDFTSVTEQLLASNADRATVSQIARHVIGQSTETASRTFDQAITSIKNDSGLSEVIPIAADYAIAKLNKRYPGEPVALSIVRDRIEALLKNTAEADARRDMVQRLEKQGLVKFLPGAAEFGKILPGSAADQATTDTQ